MSITWIHQQIHLVTSRFWISELNFFPKEAKNQALSHPITSLTSFPKHGRNCSFIIQIALRYPPSIMHHQTRSCFFALPHRLPCFVHAGKCPNILYAHVHRICKLREPSSSRCGHDISFPLLPVSRCHAVNELLRLLPFARSPELYLANDLEGLIGLGARRTISRLKLGILDLVLWDKSLAMSDLHGPWWCSRHVSIVEKLGWRVSWFPLTFCYLRCVHELTQNNQLVIRVSAQPQLASNSAGGKYQASNFTTFSLTPFFKSTILLARITI